MSTSLSIANLAANLWTDADANESGEVVKASSAVIYAIEVDNEANTVSSYVKLYNMATAPTVGTTAPDWVIEVPAGEILTLCVPKGITFGTGLAAACVTVGGTTGVAGPANDVILEIAYT